MYVCAYSLLLFITQRPCSFISIFIYIYIIYFIYVAGYVYVYIVHESAADGSGAISRVEASVLFLLAGTSLILNQFRMIYRILVEIASPWYMSGGKKRACVGLPYSSGFDYFSYLPRYIHSIYVCMYTTTIGQQKSQNTTALPSPGISVMRHDAIQNEKYIT